MGSFIRFNLVGGGRWRYSRNLLAPFSETLLQFNTAADLIISSLPRRDCPPVKNTGWEQPPMLQQTLSFRSVPRRDCSQVMNIQNMHWYVVTNAGCKDGVVKVNDSMYDSVCNVTGWPPTTPKWLTRLLNHCRKMTNSL